MRIDALAWAAGHTPINPIKCGQGCAVPEFESIITQGKHTGNCEMHLTHAEFDVHFAAAIHEALGRSDGEVDYTADLADAGFDSFLLSNLVLAFEERIGREIPQECLEAMADASNLSDVRDILQNTLVDCK